MIARKKQHTRKTFGFLMSFGLITALLVFSAWHFRAPADEAGPSTASAVDVTITEGSIEVPASVEAGTVTFNVVNAGSVAHGFAISGDTETGLNGEIPPGETQTLEVDLEAGTYTAYCPIEEHQESAEFTVDG